MQRKLASMVINATVSAHELPIVEHTPLQLSTRWLRNHLVPWIARRGFTEGVHSVHGVRLQVPRPPDWGGGGEFHMALGTYERSEMRFLLTRLEPGDVFVDVGSHVGYVALPAARAVGPTGHVFCLEPTPETFQLLRANLERNRFNQMTLVEAAASDSDGEAYLGRSQDSSMWNSLQRESREGIQVTTRSLDSVLAEAGWPSLAGIKIDAEGAEMRVLLGAQETLSRNPAAFLMLEVDGAERAEDSVRLIRFLTDSGYRLYRFAWRGLIRETLSSLQRRLMSSGGAWANLLAERPRVQGS